MRFIEVTSLDQKPVFLCVDKIIAITVDDENETVLKLTDGALYVTHTPDEILIKIRG